MAAHRRHPRDAVVVGAIDALVEHFEQAVHLQELESSVLRTTAATGGVLQGVPVDGSDQKEEECISITDTGTASLSGGCRPLKIHPVVTHWLERLQKTEQKDTGNLNHGDVEKERAVLEDEDDLHHPKKKKAPSLETICQLICGYRQSIRNTLFQNNASKSSIRFISTGCAVLINFEVLVSQYLQSYYREQSGAALEREVATTATTAEFFKTLQAMACDVSICTRLCTDAAAQDNDTDASSNDQKLTEEKLEASPSSREHRHHHILRDIVLPTILQCMCHALGTVAFMETIIDEDGAFGGNVDDYENVKKNSIARCIVSILVFGIPRLGPHQIHKSLNEQLYRVSSVYNDCQWREQQLIQQQQENSHNNHNSSILSLPPLILEDMDWDSVEINGTAWENGERTSLPGNVTTTTTSRCVQDIWSQLQQLLLVNKRNPLGDEPPCYSATTNVRVATKQHIIQETCGWERVAAGVRAHFFGRDVESDDMPLQQVKQPKARLRLGTTTYKKNNPTQSMSEEKAYRLVPSRMHVALHFISLLEAISPSILEQVLPICYELLNASSDTIVALGAVALVHLLECPLSQPAPLPSLTVIAIQSAEIKNMWKQTVVDNLANLLDMNVMTCRHGLALALVGLAQTNLFSKLHPTNEHKLRLKATQQWLMILDRNRYTNTKLVWGLLVGGVHPLLHYYALNNKEDNNCEAVELGRLALSALLPLIEEGFDEDITILALLTLQDLLIAAHPIMPHHGGKIMCTLLAMICCPSSNLEEEETPYCRLVHPIRNKLALQTAAMACIICGNRSTNVLHDILHQNQHHQKLPKNTQGPKLLFAVEQVLKIADTLGLVLEESSSPLAAAAGWP